MTAAAPPGQAAGTSLHSPAVKDQTDRSIETELAHAGGFTDRETGAVVPPIHPSTTFARDSDYEPVGDYLYIRDSSPNVALVEGVARRLDGGAAALAFGSGLAAAAALFETVPAGRGIVAPEVMYHGTLALLRRLAETRGVGLTLFDPTDPDGVRSAVREGETDLVWIETPVNPTWDVVDIAAAARAAHEAGAVLAVDSTVAPPVTTRPLQLGADLVFHSATKYYNGHSDVGAGILVTATPGTRWDEATAVRHLTGGVLGPFEAWLLLRGMRTLHLRYERASETALAVARHLERHAAVEAVLYPGLESHPGHEVAARQMTGGFGGMLSILVAGGEASARRVATRTRVFVPATSLGGVESLIEHRYAIERGVAPNLLRLSVGIEAAGDLVADLEQALGGG